MNRMRVSQAMGFAGVAAATLVLVGLTWFGTFSATRSQRSEAEARVEAREANQAALFAEQVQVDLLEVNQTLRLLAHAWETDPDHFHLVSWRNDIVLLNTIGPDLFIADEHGIVRDASVPELVGTDIQSLDYFRALSERIVDDNEAFISPTTMGKLVRLWHMNVARPLHRRDGSFAGVIVAGLRTNAVGKFYRMANIGTHGMIAVVGLDQGNLRFAQGPNPIYPGTSVAGSDMFKAMQADPDSVWVGRTALDGIERVHGFHRVADRDLAVVVAVDRDEAMHANEPLGHDRLPVRRRYHRAAAGARSHRLARHSRRASSRGGARSRTCRAGLGQHRTGTGQGAGGRQDHAAGGDPRRHVGRRGDGRRRSATG